MASWQIALGLGIGLVAGILYLITGNRSYKEHNYEWGNYTCPGENCAICYEDMDNNAMKYLRCGHALHEKCAEILIQRVGRKCPICRQSF